MFDAGKTRMIGLPYCEKNYDNTSDTGTLRTDGRTDGQTVRQTELLYQYRASVCCVLTRDKNRSCATTLLNRLKTVVAILDL